MLRFRQAVLAAGLWAAVGGVCGAQTAPLDASIVALEKGPLTVWMVTPGTDADKLRIAVQNAQRDAGVHALPTTVQQQTAGSFGKSAGDFGQAAGGYGKVSGNVGTNASDHGQTAGSYGQTAGSLGRSASDHGQTAGSYGQTVGSFGQGSDGSSSASVASVRARTEARNELALELKTFEGLEVRFVDVVADELEEKLAAVEGSAEYPDVMVGRERPQGWEQSGLAVMRVGLPSFLEIDPTRPGGVFQITQADMVDILIRAPHPERARAFVVWLRDKDICYYCVRDTSNKTAEEAARIAAGALGNVLQGDGLGAAADVDAVKFNAGLARVLALGGISTAAADGLQFKIDVTDAVANERLAVVRLRVIASSPQAFGVFYGELALRKDDGGRWKVLQVSSNVRPYLRGGGWEFIRGNARNRGHSQVVGISQASPVDGDNRTPRPDLWWDNGGGAELLAVEWQIQLGTWTDSRMYVVDDQEPRLKTRVTAEFAKQYGKYRWRVWAVGAGGVVKLSSWRELNIIP